MRYFLHFRMCFLKCAPAVVEELWFQWVKHLLNPFKKDWGVCSWGAGCCMH